MHLRDWFSVDSLGLFRAAISKVTIALMMANLRRELALERRRRSTSLYMSLYTMLKILNKTNFTEVEALTA